jgi:uncharacterized metal-binding protein YceD (DUF177 family)
VVRPEAIPEGGADYVLTADDAVRSAVAREAGLLEPPKLQASLHVERHGKGGLRVTGRVAADLCQACVVTLEPVRAELDEPVDLRFAPEAEHASPEVDLAADADPTAEPPELLTGGALDLGALANEFILLAIDPYPRKAGVAFTPPAPAEPVEGPFAALAPLKKSPPSS